MKCFSSSRPVHAVALSLVAAAAVGCVQIEVASFANLDPAGHSALIIDLRHLGLEPVEVPLQGGLEGTVAVSSGNLLSPEGLLAFIHVDSLRIAGPSFNFRGVLPTGTVCLSEDPEDPTRGIAFVRKLRGSKADMHVAAIATSSLINALAHSGLAVAADVDDVPLQIDWSRLLRFQIDGAVRASVRTTFEVPLNMPLLGGSPATLVLDLVTSSTPSNAPLLADCPQ